MDISIIVPAYNVSKYIEKCLDSLLNQDFAGSYEIIVVNDGSTDSTLEVIKKFEANQKITIVNQLNKGLSDARNAGLKCSSGDYIFFIDGDDYVTNTLLKDAFDNIGNSDLLIFGLTKLSEDGKVIYSDYPKKNQIIDEKIFWNNFYNEHPIICTTSCTKMYKKKLFDDIQFPSNKVHEDVFVLHHIIGRCRKITLLPKALYLYVKREGSITNNVKDKNALDLSSAFVSRVDYFLEKKDHKNLKRTLLSMISQYRYFYLNKITSCDVNEKIRKIIIEKLKELKNAGIKLPHFCNYFDSNIEKCFKIVLAINRFTKLYNLIKIKRT